MKPLDQFMIPFSKETFSALLALNGWVNNRNTGYLRRRHAHYDVIVMELKQLNKIALIIYGFGSYWNHPCIKKTAF